jgi:RimJ/RimL family protein N-acetyltransferase
MNDYFWQTNRIRLRQSEPEDWETIYLWNMDTQVMRDVNEVLFPESKARVKELIEKMAKKKPENDQHFMVIELRESGQFIGVINSHHCEPRVGEFMYGISIRREHQRKGYASEAIILLLRYFFDELRYQKCTVDVHGWNEASVKLHEKLGFVREGQVRRSLFTEGKHYDRYIYGMTIEEFRERYC